MQNRFNFAKAAPDAYQALSSVSQYLTEESGLAPGLIHLINLRASQINGCAFCVDMHVKEARHDGFSEQKIHLVSVWRESPVFDERERAVLGWTESLTLVSQTHAPDAAYDALRALFTEAEMTKLTLAIGVINAWNRLCVGFRALPAIDASASPA
ncbi:AhpD family alkylhydroperoxidase [Kerstersia gyiorum]|uniref:carboxymuconolactone decarboxylase family protein n=1 Tax=Kerstersia gyiorum TaxID=206506 RepID=UPI00209FE7AE|nr:carboxymuconolactone decarboxylase family protein [Kerstersia gyiorum]MCP1711443.1 AhpD family alkylhydroperoxidase [Kerstersia gyiorum]